MGRVRDPSAPPREALSFREPAKEPVEPWEPPPCAVLWACASRPCGPGASTGSVFSVGSTSWPRSCTAGCCSSGAAPFCPCAWAMTSTSWGEWVVGWGCPPVGPDGSRVPRGVCTCSLQPRCRRRPLAAGSVGEGAGAALCASEPRPEPSWSPVSVALGWHPPAQQTWPAV